MQIDPIDLGKEGSLEMQLKQEDSFVCYSSPGEVQFRLIQGKVSENARIIWGAAVDESLGEDIRVMLVLTGVRSYQIHGASENRQLRALKSRNIEFVN